MHNQFKRIGAFFLAILIWVATSSFTLSMHYCGTQMVSYSALTKAKPCCIVNKSFQFSKKIDMSSFKMTCCDDKKIEKESENELTYSIVKSEIQLQNLLLRLPQLVNFENNIQFNKAANTSFDSHDCLIKGYYPDKNILYQVFLI